MDSSHMLKAQRGATAGALQLISFLASLFLLSVIMPPPPAMGAQTGPPSPPFSDIIQALRSQEFDEALHLLQAAMKKNPEDKRLWALRGMAASGKGQSSEALASFEHSLTLDPSYLPALEGAAQIDFRNNSPKTKKLLLSILAQRPEDPTSNAMLGFVEYREKNCKDAVASFQRGQAALAQQPNALGAYGYCLASLERYEESIPVFQQALDLASRSQHLRLDLALVEWKSNHPQDALAALQPLIDAMPALPLAQLLAANIYESSNDTPKAVELLRKVILEDPKNVSAYLDFAALAFDHASLQIGIDYLNVGLTQLPHEARLYLARGVLQAELGKFHEAADDFAKADELDPHLSFPEVAQGLVASQEHRSAEALGNFRAAAKAHPDEALAQYLLAEALSQEGKEAGSPEYAEEVKAAEQATRLDPKMVAAHDLLATIYLQNDKPERAVNECRAALAIDPKDQQAVYHLVLALRKTGPKEEIPELLKKLNELRTASSADQAQNKRFRLVEVPTE